MAWIFNTDFWSMKNKDGSEPGLNSSVPLAAALMASAGEDDVIYGDPTNFNMNDEINEFDHGWDLDTDAVSLRKGDYFQGMR
jgi:hypothetical protein